MANNIFENAYFSKVYKTMDGRKAIYAHISSNGYHHILVEEEITARIYEDSGRAHYCDRGLDIVSEWQETPLEVESSKVAGKLLMLDKAKTWLMRKYPKIFDERTILDFENDMIK